MGLDSGKLAELRIKHLEMLQTVIGRMSGQGATLKNYCITLTTAVCGIAVTFQKPIAVFLALLPVIIFALLDAQYLRLERRFRSQFNSVRLEDWGTKPTFAINGEGPFWRSYLCAMFSWSVFAFYAVLAAVVVIVALIAGTIYGKPI